MILRDQSGQSLIEALLAVSVIVVGIVAILVLLVNSRVTAEITSAEIIAIQLGNESLEAARYIRDSNWLKAEDGQAVEFDDGLHNGTTYGGVYRWQPASTDPDTAISFEFVPGGSVASSEAVMYQHAGNGYRIQSSSALPGVFEPTEYSRWINLYPICYYTDATPLKETLTADGQTCADAGRPYIEMGVKVMAQVEWSSRGVIHARTVETELYNWKYADEDFSLTTF